VSRELKPDGSCAFADPPPASFFVDDPESVPAGDVGMGFAHRWRESWSFVDHFDEQAVRVKLGAYLDPPAAVNDRVGHEFANQQRGLLSRETVELLGERLGQPAARDTRRLARARQLKDQLRSRRLAFVPAKRCPGIGSKQRARASVARFGLKRFGLP
jgi:hypothetical protein